MARLFSCINISASLPPAWENQLFELRCQQNQQFNADIISLEKLTFVGRRGMGAFIFCPKRLQEGEQGKPA